MRINATLSAICMASPLAFAPAAAFAVVIDDFESYTAGQVADVADPGRFTDFAGFDVGSIAAGTATANVASSQVLEHSTAGFMVTDVNGPDITGVDTITFDVQASTGDHSVFIQDATNSLDGVFINLQTSFGAGDGLRIQAFGTGTAHDSFTVGAQNDWVRITVGIDVDEADPTQSSFTFAAYNLTQDAAIITAGGLPGSALMFQDVPLVNRVRVQTSSGGGLQLDNLTVVPEPASLALTGLGLLAMAAGRRRM